MSAQIIPVDPDNARTLARHATEIRCLGKRVVSDVIEIGRLLVESKELVGHGDWLPWLSREFQWSDTTAERFMRVQRLSLKSGNLPNLNIPLSGLYLLAAPSTPEVAKQEAVSRAEAGEPMTVNTVKKIVGRAKQAGGMAGIHNNKQTATETPQLTFCPQLEWWMWDILAVRRHLEYAMGEARKYKRSISRAEVNAIAHSFNDIVNLAIDVTEEMIKELKARGPA